MSQNDLVLSHSAAPVFDKVREQLPAEVRDLVNQMEKKWKNGINDSANGNNNNNSQAPISPRRRKNTSRSDSVTSKALAVLFKNSLSSEAGKSLIQSLPDEYLQKTGNVVFISQVSMIFVGGLM